jgi:hypothetical protein
MEIASEVLRLGWSLLKGGWNAWWSQTASALVSLRSSVVGNGRKLAATHATGVIPPEFEADISALELQEADVLGTGGFTDVFVALYRGRRVAAKVFRLEVDVEDMLLVFQNEVDALVHIERSGGHAHILRFEGATNDFHGHRTILLEYCGGGTLKECLTLGAGTNVMSAFHQIAGAVAWLHALQPKVSDASGLWF